MTHHWDEFSKSLAEKLVPRRETLRLLGAALAGVFLSPLGLKSVTAARPDFCSAFCRCSNKRQQNQCLAACRACNGDTSRLCGSCATGFACTDLASDVSNCGACGNVCWPGPLEDAACVDGGCVYLCAAGAVRCGGTCTLLESDPDNCGACGNVCPEAAPYCTQGVCSVCQPGLALCGGSCVDLGSNPDNCGACGNICPASAPHCDQGVCVANDPNPDNCGGCPEGEVCSDGYCCDPGCTPDNPSYPNCGTVCGDPCLTLWTGLTWCDRACVDLRSDPFNCGACGNVCPPEFNYCSNGACWDPICQFVEC